MATEHKCADEIARAFRRKDREIKFLREVEKSHVALLTTLGASQSGWIQWVCRNAKGRYDHLKGKYESK